MHAAESPLLSIGEFGLLAAQLPLGAGDVHALAGAQADEIVFELGEGGEDIEEHPSHGIAGVVERPFCETLLQIFDALICFTESFGRRHHCGWAG